MQFIRSLVRGVMVAALSLAGAAQAQEGVIEGSIVLGQSVALTGPGSALAVPFHQGAKPYVDRVNAAGGVNGRRIDDVSIGGSACTSRKSVSPPSWWSSA